MIGPKKLGAIREDLKFAIESVNGDPIAWLEQQMTGADRVEANESKGEVLQSLRRVLEEPLELRVSDRPAGVSH